VSALFPDVLAAKPPPQFPEIVYNEFDRGQKKKKTCCMGKLVIASGETFDLSVLPNLYGDIISDVTRDWWAELGIVPARQPGEFDRRVR
jgi:hypothetical protein